MVQLRAPTLLAQLGTLSRSDIGAVGVGPSAGPGRIHAAGAAARGKPPSPLAHHPRREACTGSFSPLSFPSSRPFFVSIASNRRYVIAKHRSSQHLSTTHPRPTAPTDIGTHRPCRSSCTYTPRQEMPRRTRHEVVSSSATASCTRSISSVCGRTVTEVGVFCRPAVPALVPAPAPAPVPAHASTPTPAPTSAPALHVRFMPNPRQPSPDFDPWGLADVTDLEQRRKVIRDKLDPQGLGRDTCDVATGSGCVVDEDLLHWHLFDFNLLYELLMGCLGEWQRGAD